MSDNPQGYLHFFAQIEEIGPITLKRLVDKFGSAKNASQASPASLLEFGLKEAVVQEFSRLKKSFDIKTELEKLSRLGIKIITNHDKNFPVLLKEIANPPQFLYYRGNLQLLGDRLGLAIVGTRKMTSYGLMACHRLIPKLSSAGLTIVSGLALGIDAAAHQITLQNNGRTIAVLGTGIDDQTIYPRNNLGLAKKIINQGGLIISEYPPASPGHKFHFPVRNRIISGLTLGTLVIEADRKSGSLITARAALDQNRNIYAVPGPINSEASMGANWLIQQGAKAVISAEDILEDLSLNNLASKREVQRSLILSAEEELVIRCLSREAKNLDDLVAETRLPVRLLGGTLAMLEMKGLVRSAGIQRWQII